MKIVLTEEHYKRLIKQLSKNRSLNENYDIDAINQSVIEILKDSSLTNKAKRFESLHELTKNVMVSLNPNFKKLLDSVANLKTYADIWTGSLEKDKFWELVNSNKINFINSKASKKNKANDEKITENFSTNISPLLDILNLMKTGQIDDQSILSFCEDTDYSKTTSDGHEAFAALLFSKYLNQNYLITPSAEKGVDCKQMGGPYTIESKGSTSAVPNTQFSGTLPKYSLTHFYIFLTTDRSYIIRSDILRAYYVLTVNDIEEEAETFFKGGIVGNYSQTQGQSLKSLKNFILTTNPADQKLQDLKGKSFESIYRSIYSLPDTSEIKILYRKVLSEIESQSQSLSVTLLQSLLGFEGVDRVAPPQINVGGVYVYLRPVLQGEESSSSDSSILLPTQTGDNSNVAITKSMNLHTAHVHLSKQFQDAQTNIKNNIFARYKFDTANIEIKEKILVYTLAVIKEKIDKELSRMKIEIFNSHLSLISYEKNLDKLVKALEIATETHSQTEKSVSEYMKNFEQLLKTHGKPGKNKLPKKVFDSFKQQLKLPNRQPENRGDIDKGDLKILKKNYPPKFQKQIQLFQDIIREEQALIGAEMDTFINKFIDDLEAEINSYKGISIPRLYEVNKNQSHKKRLLKYIKNHKM